MLFSLALGILKPQESLIKDFWDPVVAWFSFNFDKAKPRKEKENSTSPTPSVPLLEAANSSTTSPGGPHDHVCINCLENSLGVRLAATVLILVCEKIYCLCLWNDLLTRLWTDKKIYLFISHVLFAAIDMCKLWNGLSCCNILVFPEGLQWFVSL